MSMSMQSSVVFFSRALMSATALVPLPVRRNSAQPTRASTTMPMRNALQP